MEGIRKAMDERNLNEGQWPMSSKGIINYPTQLHIVGHFRILCYDAREHENQRLFFFHTTTDLINAFISDPGIVLPNIRNTDM